MAQDFRVNDIQGIPEFLRRLEREAWLIGLSRAEIERVLGGEAPVGQQNWE